jgi:hypothetical protein
MHRSIRPFTSITFEAIPQWSAYPKMLYARNRQRRVEQKLSLVVHTALSNMLYRELLIWFDPGHTYRKDLFVPFKHKAATRINLPENKKNKITVQLHTIMRYSRSNSTKSPASGAGIFSEPTLMSQEGRMGEFASVYVTVCFLQWERWRCQYSSVYVAAAIMWLG